MLVVAVGAIISAAAWMVHSEHFSREATLAAVALMAVAVFLRENYADTVDEVWDDGDELVVTSGAVKHRIPLRTVRQITASTLRNPPEITLTFHSATPFGTEIRFIAAPDTMRSLSPHSTIFDDLRRRVSNPENG